MKRGRPAHVAAWIHASSSAGLNSMKSCFAPHRDESRVESAVISSGRMRTIPCSQVACLCLPIEVVFDIQLADLLTATYGGRRVSGAMRSDRAAAEKALVRVQYGMAFRNFKKLEVSPV